MLLPLYNIACYGQLVFATAIIESMAHIALLHRLCIMHASAIGEQECTHCTKIIRTDSLESAWYHARSQVKFALWMGD